ncbi:hypothetical protein FAIPA1_130015 [Frankia sp. AiPs1]|uniref:hypothetical protein n=1 Tax=Frankia sp. AiPa1 TaxID=573492 RepID=UPI00202AC757|nr:hypothetical protein [Frankia sp. AiPa1]MCL9760461.1 hypothetical protein [Frankia sp. AiPa1]
MSSASSRARVARVDARGRHQRDLLRGYGYSTFGYKGDFLTIRELRGGELRFDGYHRPEHPINATQVAEPPSHWRSHYRRRDVRAVILPVTDSAHT